MIKANKIWSGVTGWSGGMWFETKDINDVDKIADGISMKNVSSIFITNLDHGRRHQPLSLMSMQDNLKFSRHKEIRGKNYIKYDNYDAIEVPYTDAIPSDYDGIIGVPISFLDKYCPEQFEILGTSDNGIISDKYKVTQGLTQKFVDDYYKSGGKGAYKEGNPTAGAYIDGIATMIYKRIFIRHKRGKNGNKT